MPPFFDFSKGFSGGGGMPGGSSNQFFPTLPGMPNPGRSGGGGFQPNAQPFIPTSGAQAGTPGFTPGAFSGYAPNVNNPYGEQKLAKNLYTEPTADPTLSQNWGAYLNSQTGKGAQQYGGQLTAGLDPFIAQLESFLKGDASKIPGADFLQQLASGGAPGVGNQTLQNVAQNGISALPTWNPMVAAQQQNIKQNEAQLKEQSAFAGQLAGTPFANANANYLEQTTKDQNATLAQLQFQGDQLQVGAAGTLAGDQQGAAQGIQDESQKMGAFLQSLDQETVTNLYNEFLRTRPEYNPLLGAMGQQANSYAPIFNAKTGQSSGGGVAGGILSNLGTLGGAATAGLGASAGGAGIMSSILAGLAAL